MARFEGLSVRWVRLYSSARCSTRWSCVRSSYRASSESSGPWFWWPTLVPSRPLPSDKSVIRLSELRRWARQIYSEDPPVPTFVRVKGSAGASQLAPWPLGTPLTSPLSVSGSHDHVCIAPDSWPPKQTVPSGRSTVIVQRPPTSCASPPHPLELAMCAIQPVGPHME
jgi:hypothetical protein